MSHIISIHRPSVPRQTAVSEFPRSLYVWWCSGSNSTLVVPAERLKHSAIAAMIDTACMNIISQTFLYPSLDDIGLNEQSYHRH